MEDVVGIVMALGSGEPFGVATIALGDADRVASAEQVRVSAGKGNRIEGPKCGSRPLAMPLLFVFVRRIREKSEDLDEHMVSAKSKGRRFCGHSRRGALEFVGEDGAAG